MVSENLSRANFSAANSRRNGLYFSSDLEVRLDANAIGWSLVTTFPLGRTVSNRCASTAPNASLHPSVVTIKGVPSHLGPLSTGSAVMAAFRARNALLCSSVQCSLSLKLDITRRYTDLVCLSGMLTFRNRSRSGCSFLA